MASVGKSVATLIIGAAIGAAVGYVLATDEDKRNEQLDHLKDKMNDLKKKISKKTEDIEDEIFN